LIYDGFTDFCIADLYEYVVGWNALSASSVYRQHTYPYHVVGQEIWSIMKHGISTKVVNWHL